MNEYTKNEENMTNIQQLEQLGIHFFQEGNYEEAERYLVQAFEQEPDLERFYNVIHVKYKLGKFSEVVYLGEKYLEIDENEKYVLDMVGDSYYYLQQYKQSMDMFVRLQKISYDERVYKKIVEVKRKLEEQQEKRRLEKWAEEFYYVSSYGEKGRQTRTLQFPILFKDHVLEYLLMSKLIQYGFQNIPQVKVLDVGCGEGRWLRKLVDWGASPKHLAGVDLDGSIIQLAKELCAKDMTLLQAHGDELPFANESFDVVLTIGVLQHIKDKELRKKVSNELSRVLKKGGIIFTYNLNKKQFAKSVGNLFIHNTTIGIEMGELEEMFPEHEIVYEEVLLADSVIFNVIPEQWGTLFDKATQSKNFNHGYGIAVICKK
ncbi:2-polyprenyl-3-methyl-5-hydroxy-6-metoxy-1,4-benzoquinol methylase [Anoxybacillus voinovskiensis]|uniref:2-polyprenyl-3-methyl-5-hydroxy-6-metoxy-1, 4-benzoquinol methylase n=1 Tax=Anoxybacteroides voinovskiense TaxID=230470 RepID=A0A840DW50_9BACL|nr:class I SAM-dependent methyltransferase [Anoxybacillus voinovskiensis]MBB4073749.1 2-polyprenyl-3-methyl-5-hydroxy-6-metoxy-1,4-benzoquinol methylase [Anoxybacillus voinovskiensis]GGJ64207.1 hypothetical protein GCM10008982_11810 [Anoxybacillus voinovskiensis]